MSEMPNELATLAAAVRNGDVGVELASARPSRRGTKQSAVLAAFTPDQVILVERARSLGRHSGQIAFPGGRLEPGETYVEAALREAWEETGIDPAEVEVIGELPGSSIPVSQFDVVPVVASWPTPRALPGGDPREIAGVSLVAVADLVDPGHRFTAQVPATGFTTPAFEVDGLWVWGFTAFVLDALLRAGGWERAWDVADVRPVPARLLGGRGRGGPVAP